MYSLAPARRSQHANATYRNMLRAFGHRVVMCCDMQGVVGSSLKMVNLSQQHPTCRNRVAKHTQHVAPNNVAMCCVGMLRSFDRGLRIFSLATYIKEKTKIHERLQKRGGGGGGSCYRKNFLKPVTQRFRISLDWIYTCRLQKSLNNVFLATLK